LKDYYLLNEQSKRVIYQALLDIAKRIFKSFTRIKIILIIKMNPQLLPQLQDQQQVPREFPENFVALLNTIIPIDEVINYTREQAGLPPLTPEEVQTVNTRIVWIVSPYGEIGINILPSVNAPAQGAVPSLRSAYAGTPQRVAQIERQYFNLRPEAIEQYLSDNYGMTDASLDLYRHHRNLTATYTFDEDTTEALIQMAKDMNEFVRLHTIRSAANPIVAQRQQDETTAAVLQYARTVHPDIFTEIITTQLGSGNYTGLVKDIDERKRVAQLQRLIGQQQAKSLTQRNQAILQQMRKQLQSLR